MATSPRIKQAGNAKSSVPLGPVYVGNVASLGDFRRTLVQRGLSVFCQCCIDARNVLKQAWINFIDEPAQASGFDAEIARRSEYNSSELPQGGADLLPMVIEAFEWRELVIGRRNERVDIIRAAMTEHLVE